MPDHDPGYRGTRYDAGNAGGGETVLLVLLIRRKAGWEEGYIVYCVFSGAFGLFFGLLCSIVYIFTSGPSGALGWWISGIPFDILHGAGNFTLSLILFKPLSAALRQIQRKFS